jgi:hypothetical protein
VGGELEESVGINFVKRIFCIYWKQIQLHYKPFAHAELQKHQRIKAACTCVVCGLIAIELIENKLDENKESIELTILFDYSYAVPLPALALKFPAVRSSQAFQLEL